MADDIHPNIKPAPREDEAACKAELAKRIAGIVDSLAISQREAAKRAGISQPNLSKIIMGRVHDVRLDRLLACIVCLGSDIEIIVRPSTKTTPARITIANDSLHRMERTCLR